MSSVLGASAAVADRVGLFWVSCGPLGGLPRFVGVAATLRRGGRRRGAIRRRRDRPEARANLMRRAPPSVAVVAGAALDPAAPHESIRDVLMARIQNVDAIVPLALDDGPGRSIAIDADQHGRRIERQRDRGSNGQPRSRFSGAGCDHAHAADEMPHRILERRRQRGLREDLSKRHRHCATLARSEARRLADSTITPSQKTLAQ